MVVVWNAVGLSLRAKTFDGSSWSAVTTELDADTAVTTFRVCSHPDSAKMMIVWLSAETPTTIKARQVYNGTMDALTTVYQAPSLFSIEKVDVACNASGEVVIAFAMTEGVQKKAGGVIYGP
jgi:hypothetical protein